VSAAEQYPFVEMDPAAGSISRMPYLPFRLELGGKTASVSGLLDTGAAINVLPYSIGLALGAVWDAQKTQVKLTGNLSATEARVLVVNTSVGALPTVRLAFAWAKSDAMPILLGQVNFFLEFDVCFYRAKSIFEIRRPS
jgi:hypothetical protein